MNAVNGKNRWTLSKLKLGEFQNQDGSSNPYIDVDLSLVSYQDGNNFTEYPERVAIKTRVYFFTKEGKPSKSYQDLASIIGVSDPAQLEDASNFPGLFESYIQSSDGSYTNKDGQVIAKKNYYINANPPKKFGGMSDLRAKLGMAPAPAKPLPQSNTNPTDEFRIRKGKLFADWVAFNPMVEEKNRVSDFIEWCGLVDQKIVETRTITTVDQVEKLEKLLESDKQQASKLGI